MELTPEQMKAYYDMAYPFVTGGLMAVFILTIGWMVSKWAHRLGVNAAKRGGIDEALGRFFGQLLRYAVLAFAVIAALSKVGIETTSVIAVFGAAGFAVGLALQGSLSNFAAGVMILFFRPFSLGDVVNTGGHTGKIEDIGLFATTMGTPDNHTIIIPNGAITGGSIINYTKKGIRRATIAVGVAYGENLQQVMDVCMKVARENGLVLEDPAPAMAFTEMAASSLNFNLFVFANVPDWLPVQHQVRCDVYDALNEAGIDIPFNQIVVHQAEAA